MTEGQFDWSLCQWVAVGTVTNQAVDPTLFSTRDGAERACAQSGRPSEPRVVISKHGYDQLRRAIRVISDMQDLGSEYMREIGNEDDPVNG